MEYEIPKEHYLDEEKREGVRDWILAVSLDSQLTNALDTAPCVVCDVETFVGNEVCRNCQVILSKQKMKPLTIFVCRRRGNCVVFLDSLYKNDAFQMNKDLRLLWRQPSGRDGKYQTSSSYFKTHT